MDDLAALTFLGAFAGLMIALLALAFWASSAAFFGFAYPTELHFEGLAGMCAVMGVVGSFGMAVWQDFR